MNPDEIQQAFSDVEITEILGEIQKLASQILDVRRKVARLELRANRVEIDIDDLEKRK